jgi:hypothetical protein
MKRILESKRVKYARYSTGTCKKAVLRNRIQAKISMRIISMNLVNYGRQNAGARDLQDI